MKKAIYLFMLLAIVSITTAQSKNLKAYLSYYTFNTPEQKPYIETHISVLGSSVKYTKTNTGAYQGSIGITLLVKQAEKIIKAEKYNLLSPEFKDTLNINANFLDQKRFELDNGKYTLELYIQDNNNSSNKDKVTQEFEVNFPPNKIAVSDIILLESYAKANTNNQFIRNGFELIPFVNNFLPTNINKLSFYAEIYNTQLVAPDESFLLSYYLQNAEGLNKLSTFIQNKKVVSKNVLVLLNEFDISLLPSGNYYLVLNCEIVIMK